MRQRFPGRFQLLFGEFPVGDVSGDLSEADMTPVVIVNRVDDRIHPESSAILAQAPAFIFEPAFAKCSSKRAPRQIGSNVLAREETREVLTDDLVAGVALEPFGAQIPGSNPTIRIQHIDGVIGDRPDQQAEALLFGQAQ